MKRTGKVLTFDAGKKRGFISTDDEFRLGSAETAILSKPQFDSLPRRSWWLRVSHLADEGGV